MFLILRKKSSVHNLKSLWTLEMVRETGLEPVRKNTRPSNVRVCLFRHSRVSLFPLGTVRIIAEQNEFVNSFFNIFFNCWFFWIQKVYGCRTVFRCTGEGYVGCREKQWRLWRHGWILRCNKCGWELEKRSAPPKFCPECGDVFDNDAIPMHNKSKWGCDKMTSHPCWIILRCDWF